MKALRTVMEPLRLFVLATVFILVSTGIVSAREVRPWSYQELLDKSDLVVIATPTAVNDTKDRINLPGFVGQPVIGVETKFGVSAVLKGDEAIKDFVLHHYRADKMTVPNGPSLISFEPAKRQTFLLFLVREADGRYAPAFGQMDPGLCGINVFGDGVGSLHVAALPLEPEPSGRGSTPTNSFGIYLTAESVDRRILTEGTDDWSHVKLQPTPLISDADIVAYDFTKHWMTLTPEAFKRLPRPSVSGTPFVVVANGERVYLGAFTTPESSIPAFVPSIISAGRNWYTYLPPDTLQIDRGYPGPREPAAPDQRPDERIKRALGALRKLKHIDMATDDLSLRSAAKAETNVRSLNPIGLLGKRLGTRTILGGVLAERVMLDNPLAATEIDGQAVKEVSIEIRGNLRIQRGVYYRIEGYEAGEFSGPPSWLSPQAQQTFQFRSFFVVTKVIESKTK